jgi:hypothetical protein
MNILVCMKQILDPEIPARDFRIDSTRREAERGSAALVTGTNHGEKAVGGAHQGTVVDVEEGAAAALPKLISLCLADHLLCPDDLSMRRGLFPVPDGRFLFGGLAEVAIAFDATNLSDVQRPQADAWYPPIFRESIFGSACPNRVPCGL